MKRCKMLLIILTAAAVMCSQTREPAVAGSWYPNDAVKLEKMLSGFFGELKTEKNDIHPIGLISPHAGFIYSGKVAAHGYSLVQGKHYDTVILLGSSHHYFENVVSIYDGDFAMTPLGKIPIDKEISGKLLAADKKFVFQEKIHLLEHSLEAQLPFLQYVLDDFKVVLILTSTNDFQLLDKLAAALTEIARNSSKKLLFINSTDMSHFHDYQFAVSMDRHTCDLIVQKKWDVLQSDIISGKSELCGYFALYPFLQVMENLLADPPFLLQYANSGDATGDTDSKRVVGYCSIVFPQKIEKTDIEEKTMKKEDKKYLLNLARESIRHYLRNRRELQIEQPENPEFLKERAVFVTLNQNDNLRGCIGHMQARMPLYQAVIEMAVGAAFEDPRFTSVKDEKELENINIEISILSPMVRIYDYRKIRLGIDGVWIKKGFHSGVFLPQVATETGWDLDTFLGNLCAHKAGLSYDAYKDAKTEIYIYQVEKFEEE